MTRPDLDGITVRAEHAQTAINEEFVDGVGARHHRFERVRLSAEDVPPLVAYAKELEARLGIGPDAVSAPDPAQEA